MTTTERGSRPCETSRETPRISADTDGGAGRADGNATASGRTRESAARAVRDRAGDAAGAMHHGIDGARRRLGSATGAVSDGLDGARDRVGSATGAVSDGLDGARDRLGSVTGSVSDGIDGARERLGTATEAVSDGIDGARERLGSAADALADGVQSVRERVGGEPAGASRRKRLLLGGLVLGALAAVAATLIARSRSNGGDEAATADGVAQPARG